MQKYTIICQKMFVSKCITCISGWMFSKVRLLHKSFEIVIDNV